MDDFYLYEQYYAGAGCVEQQPQQFDSPMGGDAMSVDSETSEILPQAWFEMDCEQNVFSRETNGLPVEVGAGHQQYTKQTGEWDWSQNIECDAFAAAPTVQPRLKRRLSDDDDEEQYSTRGNTVERRKLEQWMKRRRI